jgi:hypothetical protein
VEVELVSHSLANRIIRLHTGRRSAAEVFFRGDKIDEDSFDGGSGILSINYNTLMSVRWEPYAMGDDGVSPAGEVPQLSRATLVGALRLIVDELALNDRLQAARPSAASSKGDPSSPAATEARGGRRVQTPGAVPSDVPTSRPTEASPNPADSASAGPDGAPEPKTSKRTRRPPREPQG